jgi:hypothetical protein
MDGHSHWRPFPLSDRSPPYNSGRRSDGMQIWGCLLASKTPLGASRQRSGNAVGRRGVGWPRHAGPVKSRAHPSTSSPRTKPTTAPRSDDHDLSLLNEALREVVRSRGPGRCRPQRRRPAIVGPAAQRWPVGRCLVHRPSASPTTSGGSGQSSVSQMARSSSTSRTVTCWFARMQAAQASTIRCLMVGTD